MKVYTTLFYRFVDDLKSVDHIIHQKSERKTNQIEKLKCIRIFEFLVSNIKCIQKHPFLKETFNVKSHKDQY